jgi:hypothetical protein
MCMTLEKIKVSLLLSADACFLWGGSSATGCIFWDTRIATLNEMGKYVGMYSR